jgi:hypothetical protein
MTIRCLYEVYDMNMKTRIVLAALAVLGAGIAVLPGASADACALGSSYCVGLYSSNFQGACAVAVYNTGFGTLLVGCHPSGSHNTCAFYQSFVGRSTQGCVDVSGDTGCLVGVSVTDATGWQYVGCH